MADRDLVARGRACTLAWARDRSGLAPAREFLDSDAVGGAQRARLAHWFRVLADHGRIANTEAFRHEGDGIWAFKAGAVRVAAFQQGRIWYLTHGFMKQRRRWPRQELERAKRIRAEHLERAGRQR